MKKKVIVISLGGSLIVPDNVDYKFLNNFKKVILKNKDKYKFVIVCGGGSVARKYISALRETGKNEYYQSLAGISVTRMNARFMNYFFDFDASRGVPHNMRILKKYLKKNGIVFCGGLEYKPHQTSDSTSAQVASYFGSDFINLTNVPGLYDKNPLAFKSAKFIPEISWKNFNKMAQKIKFEPGQHFVLDQTAAKEIMKYKIKTYIAGQDMKQLDNLLNGKKFIGSVING